MKQYAYFYSEQRGAVSVATAILLSTLVMLIGGVLDFGRAYLVQAGVKGALDAATLAAAKTDLSDPAQMTAATTSAQRYFQANFAPGSFGSNISASSISLNITPIDRYATQVVASLGQGAAIKTNFIKGAGGTNSMGLGNDTEVVQNKTDVARYFEIHLGAMDMPAATCSDDQNWAVPVLDGKYTVRAIPFSNFPSKFSDNGTPGRFGYKFINGFCRGIGVSTPGDTAPRSNEIDPAVNGRPREGLKVDFGGMRVSEIRVGIRDIYTEDCFTNGPGCWLEDRTAPATYKEVQEQYCPPVQSHQSNGIFGDFGQN